MKRLIMTALVLLLCMALLAGCTKPEPAADPAPAPEEPATELPAKEEKEEPTEEAPVEEEPAEEETAEEVPAEEEPELAEEPAPIEGPVKIAPLPETVDMRALDECTVSVSLEEGNATAEQMTVTVYTYYLYDMVDIAQLKEGDTIELGDGDVTVDKLERNEAGMVYINGGLDFGGYELVTDESGVYYERGYSDAKAYHALGEVTLPIAEDFVFTDSSDLDSDPVTYTAADLANGTVPFFFVPHNTKIVISGGSIVSMERVYVP